MLEIAMELVQGRNQLIFAGGTKWL